LVCRRRPSILERLKLCVCSDYGACDVLLKLVANFPRHLRDQGDVVNTHVLSFAYTNLYNSAEWKIGRMKNVCCE
jgi:hypothetical protein